MTVVVVLHNEGFKYDEIWDDASGWAFTLEGRLQVFKAGVVHAEYTKDTVHSVYRRV